MTPEKARELFENATPGPWVCVDENEEYPRVARVGYKDITNDAENYNATLIAAAPELAEIVAGMRFMYCVAVEMPHGTGYLAEDIDGDIWVHSDHHFPAVMWFAWDKDAEDVAYFWNREHPERATARVVRRLVSEPEEVE